MSQNSSENQIVHVQSRRNSINSESSTDSDSSLGFGDFENDVYGESSAVANTENANFGNNSPQNGSKVDKLQVRNSTGVIVGNQTFIEGTVIFDRAVGNNFELSLERSLSEKLQNEQKDTYKKTSTTTKITFCQRWKTCILIFVTFSIILVISAIVATFLLMNLKDDNGAETSEQPETSTIWSTTSTEITSSSTFSSSTESPSSTVEQISSTTPLPPLTYTFISKSEWVVGPPPTGLEPISHPVKSIVITETNSNPCNSNSSCIKIVRAEQEKFLKMSWDDIGHSFLAADFNAIYEGRGWNASGQHVRPEGGNCYVIAFIGTFNFKRPTEDQINAYFALIEEGVRAKYIHEDYEMVGLCQIAGVNRPGTVLREMLKSWPHWKETERQCT
ncbi:N-acetylmuramoyl-L-alanine amidase-like [Culicoides brevitarsis]|uniref:N-acetylmuramoyl-L-alanine amidase-like n=1 Tax=Culicoides brevitarsis TaxID=469753 RepID=UPI00307B39A4